MHDGGRGGLLRGHGRPRPRRRHGVPSAPVAWVPCSSTWARCRGTPQRDAVRRGPLRAGVRSTLAEFAAAGHEIASHGPDHGRLPVQGDRRLAAPGARDARGPSAGPRDGVSLAALRRAGGGRSGAYRDQLAEAGYDYVSDTSLPGGRLAGARAPRAAVARRARRRGQLPASAASGRRDPGGGATISRAGGALLPLLRLRRHRARAARGALVAAGQAGARPTAGSPPSSRT